MLGDDWSTPTRNTNSFAENTGTGGDHDSLKRREDIRSTGTLTTGVTTELVPEPVDAESNEIGGEE